MYKKTILIFVIAVLFLLPAYGQKTEYKKSNIVQISPRAIAIMQSVKCLVCQGQTIAQSQSPFAENIRLYILQNLDFKTDSQIYKNLQNRFGNSIKIQSKFTGNTYIIYIIPILILSIICIAFIIGIRKRKTL